jgi:hypothetical protein
MQKSPTAVFSQFVGHTTLSTSTDGNPAHTAAEHKHAIIMVIRLEMSPHAGQVYDDIVSWHCCAASMFRLGVSAGAVDVSQ